ncbi:MAG TPA: Hsp20/alpha crystallin family protein [Ignavibacteriaceae bacterium]|nr:Hsp20/alpha crystallin family protein [Ignavibacteriaceae bacterium]
MNTNRELISLKTFTASSIEELLQTQNVVTPLVDIVEQNDEFILIANLPGLQRDYLQVKVEESNLVIFGKIGYDTASTRKYILQENEIGNYYRLFKISDTIDKNKISAKYDNGQLIVSLPKTENAKPRTIEIQ